MKNTIILRLLIAIVIIVLVILGIFFLPKLLNKSEKAPAETTTVPLESTTVAESTTVVASEPTTVEVTAATTATSGTAFSKNIAGALPYFSWDMVQKLDPNYFGDSVFIGDSTGIKFQMYGGLPGATYLCYANFSSTNALNGYVKANIWDCIGGKKRVYIMLGMNDLNPVGVEGAVANMQKLCTKIVEANPGVLIYIESMTPVTKNKDGTNGRLSKDYIHSYNEQLSTMAANNGWYFVDVASTMYTDDGYLKDEYCGDNGPEGLGLHLSNAGCEAWCEYLKTHCYDPSWKVEEGE